MGARNAIAAMHLYAGLIPHMSMVLLLRMALVSKDTDPDPWYGEGHEALARFALGRGRHAALSRGDIRSVERAIAPLHAAGAITTDRHAAARIHGPNTVRYRLNLKEPATPPTRIRKARKPVDNPAEDPQRPPVSDHDVHRFVGTRPPVSDHTSTENRWTEDKEETQRSDKPKEESSSDRDSPPQPTNPPQDQISPWCGNCTKGWTLTADTFHRCPCNPPPPATPAEPAANPPRRSRWTALNEDTNPQPTVSTQ